ncbi:hypothetical protein OIU84_029453 [Salix udensis]|uniref:Uncharacterized protein n=1 Tax=Salix udensis TaxID=889485 RepID=A0AAD6K9E8_9ROSI|nr:hypothetical protein OIU84_029453 [Salix udensis]
MASTPSDGEVAVFTDTNMDTHIAMGISPDITVADFKRELEKMHFNCFPKMGVVKVFELKVRRNNCFYHLPESLPVKYAFQGFKGNWFLHVAIRSSNSFRNKHSPQCLDAKDGDISDGSNVIGSLVTDTRKNDMIPNGNSKRIKGLLGIKSPAELPKTVIKEPGTAELSKNAPYFKKMSKEKKRLADINNEFERSKKALNVAAKVSSGLLTPRNEVQHATIAEALPKIVACSKKRSKEKKRMAGLNKELDRRKKAPNLAAAKVCSGLLTPKNQVDIRTPPRTLPTDLRPGSSGNKLKTTSAVGKLMMTAANKLKSPANERRPALSSYRFRAPFQGFVCG